MKVEDVDVEFVKLDALAAVPKRGKWVSLLNELAQRPGEAMVLPYTAGSRTSIYQRAARLKIPVKTFTSGDKLYVYIVRNGEPGSKGAA